jgi:hypothetical protein
MEKDKDKDKADAPKPTADHWINPVCLKANPGRTVKKKDDQPK